MVAANIPWTKLNNPILKGFLTKYTNKQIPDESTLRKNYLHPQYLSTIEKIKENIGASYFWTSVYETTDRCGRYIANIVVGKVDSTGPSSPHLIASRVLEVANSSTIAREIQTFDVEDAVSIREAKVATSSSTVVSDLANVKSYFGNLPGVIVSLEARNLPLIESVKIMHTIQEGVKQTPGPVASSVATKLEQVLQRNTGWRTMVAVPDILGGQSTPLQEIRRVGPSRMAGGRGEGGLLVGTRWEEGRRNLAFEVHRLHQSR
uniref:Uncharacterized protein n=1 Tax=Timema monikensis TaxID=170555 RepID=A0A7R9EKQ2_9NEOP|nr:unnamed protein product [Timema monikensis]